MLPHSAQRARHILHPGGDPATAALTGPGKAPGWDALSIALAATILAYVWRVHMIYPILTTLKFPILVALAALGLYLFDTDPRRRLKAILAQPVTKLALFIYVLAVLSIPTSLYQGFSLAFVRDDFGRTILLMVVLTASVRSFEDVERFVGVLVVGALLYGFHVYTKVQIGSDGRFGSLLYYDANDLGMLLVCTIPLAIYFLRTARRSWVRVAMVPVLGLYLLVFIKAGSRGGFLALIALALYFLFAYSTIRKGVRVLAIVAGVGILMVFGSETYWKQMSTLLEPSKDYNAAGNNEVGRMAIWKRGMGYMFSRPITGVGARAFETAEGTISPLATRQERGIGLKWSTAHNSFVEIGAELGVFGLLALVYLLYRAYRTARAIGTAAHSRAPPNARALGQALAGCVVGYVVGGFFISQAYAVYMFTVYGLIAALANVTAGADARPAPASAVSRNAPATHRRRMAATPQHATPPVLIPRLHPEASR